jgi:hypothetical protein
MLNLVFKGVKACVSDFIRIRLVVLSLFYAYRPMQITTVIRAQQACERVGLPGVTESDRKADQSRSPITRWPIKQNY